MLFSLVLSFVGYCGLWVVLLGVLLGISVGLLGFPLVTLFLPLILLI